MFITMEGVEGCGKTTIAQRLAEVLQSNGQSVLLLRDPGDTRLGEQIRQVLLHAPGQVEPLAELLLFWAARRQLVVERIVPALQRGTVVICDRFFDSTTAYQGHGRGLPREVIVWLRRTICAGCEPEITVLLDIDPAIGLERARVCTGGLDRIESSGVEFMRRVREGFLTIAREEPHRVAVVPVRGTVDEVFHEVQTVLSARLATVGITLQEAPQEPRP